MSNASNTDGLGDLPAVTTTISPQEECLKTRKWYCFLLSSIFTFLAGLFIILIWRAFAFLCCSRKRKASAAGKAAQAKAAAQAAQEAAGGQGASQRKAPGEGATEIGLMTEAKDWAGGLISGQTTTGRILVSNALLSLFLVEALLYQYSTAPRYEIKCSLDTSVPSKRLQTPLRTLSFCSDLRSNKYRQMNITMVSKTNSCGVMTVKTAISERAFSKSAQLLPCSWP